MKFRLNAAIIAATACVGFGFAGSVSALDITAMTQEERKVFRAEVRAYLLENPQVIMDAVAVLEERQNAQKVNDDVALVQVNAEELFNDPNSWVGGNPDGDITLVEFLDYRCGYCRKAHDVVHNLLKEDGNIRLIVKEFPILGDESTASSRFAVATRLVAGDAAYEAATNALIRLTGATSEQVFRRLATTLDLDGDAILAKMDSDEVTQIIADNHALGQRMQISGTPTFIMQDQMLRGFLPLQGMVAMAREIREK